jgi:radical SAM superfamily enzyme YgiQ (UPF0313 family)
MIRSRLASALDRSGLRPVRPDARLGTGDGSRPVLRLYLVKASRYDDSGRLLQFRRGVIPGHTLSVLAGLARAWAHERAQVELQLVVWDELVDAALDAATIASIVDRGARDGVHLLIGLSGVQTGEYPRARDIGLQLRGLGAAVAIGGFHVSSDPGSRQFLQSAGLSVVTGEAEHTLGRLLDDFLAGRLRPGYAAEGSLLAKSDLGMIPVPDLDAAPMPSIETRYLQRFFNTRFATVDTSRGCPFVCSFCAVKNVMGRSVRARDPNRVIAWIEHAHDLHGIESFLIVDDDLFRSPSWEPVLSGIAGLRRSGRTISLFLQSDVQPAAPGADRDGRRFIELAAAAGCYQVFMGFESLEAADVAGLRKHQNRAAQDRQDRASRSADGLDSHYREIVSNWHAAGVGVHCGYMLGLPGDRAGCGERAARRLSEIGVDIVSFFAATPLPGTEDHRAAATEGSLLVSDWNSYDTTHFVRRHAVLSRAELEREYRDAWRSFYSLRRLAWSAATLHGVAGLGWPARTGMLAQQLYYGYASRRGWHPMLGGILRRPTAERRRVVDDEQARSLYLPACPSAAEPERRAV